LLLLTLIGEESAYPIFCDCWDTCRQSNSTSWSRQ